MKSVYIVLFCLAIGVCFSSLYYERLEKPDPANLIQIDSDCRFNSDTLALEIELNITLDIEENEYTSLSQPHEELLKVFSHNRSERVDKKLITSLTINTLNSGFT